MAVLAAPEAAAERAADGLGEARDFAILVHLMISDFVVIPINCGNCGTSGKKPKTYGRFLGTIFFGGVGSRLVAERQGVAREKIPQNRKNSKKSVK